MSVLYALLVKVGDALKGRFHETTKVIKLTTDVYRLIAGSWGLVSTDQWILVPFWLQIRPVILSLVSRRIWFSGKKYSTMYRRTKSEDSFTIEQNVALPTKIISLRLRIHASTGRLYLFWLLSTRNDPLDV